MRFLLILICKIKKNKIKMSNKTYLYNDVYKNTLEYFNGDELATNVWITKYCNTEVTDDGETIYYERTPDDMFHRIAREISRVGMKYDNPLTEDEVYDLIKEYKYILFAGRPMAGIGVNDAVSISNCFVVGKPKQDSYGTIATIDQEIMQLSKRGGGVGTDLSDYRPNGAKVHNAAKTSSGPVEICATRFSNTIREVGQSGRRGALMLSMSVEHPSADEFINAKMEDGKITGANISIKLFDEWLKSALGVDCEVDVNKNKLWKKIIHNATTKAEPGILYWDTIINESVADCYKEFGYETTSTNPCGELPLCPEDSCRLMALNLYSYVDNPFTKNAKFNYEKFIDHCKKTMKIMDNMIELELEKVDAILAKIENDPEDDDIKMVEKNLWTRIRKKCKEGRRSGIGITAMGDMLAALNLKYGTKEATNFAADIQRILATAVYIESCDLVQRDNRPAFGCFDFQLEKNNPFLNRLANEGWEYGGDEKEYIGELSRDFRFKWMNNRGRRNIACLTIAPTGSLSTQTQTTSGIEPVFMISYRRRRKIDKNSGIKADFIDKTGDAFIEFNVVHHKFIEWYAVNHDMNFNEAKSYLEKLSDKDIATVISQSPYYGATAMDCDWHERVNMQGKIQKFVDHSISVTVNLPRGTSEETVEDVYKTAWISGCKGCTIYVDGSRDGVLVNKEEKKKCECNEFIETNTPKRPKKLPCKIVKFTNKGVKWIAAVGLYEGKPYEIFTGLAERLNIPNGVESGYIIRNKVPKEIFNEDSGKNEIVKVSRYDIEYTMNGETITIPGLSTIFNEEYWNYGKLISAVLRHGMPVNYVVKVVSSMDFKNDGINSWKNGVIRALKTFTKDEDLHEPCPKCGGHLRRESGCVQCMDCGWSKCGAN
jgi:ribonucleoside-diphosphate reductase alpha chain